MVEHTLVQTFREAIASGLRRESVTTPVKWAEMYRVMGKPFPGNWSWKRHPWLKAMHSSTAIMNIGQKSAQMGFTETLLNKTFFMIDVKRVNCLYVLPNTVPDAKDFSAARFDPALEMSPHLENLFDDVKNVGHKRAGSTSLFVRGANSRSGLKGLPIAFIALDELDEMNQDNVLMSWERASGQEEKELWMVSTPTTPNLGINKAFQTSTQEHFFFRCPACSKMIDLTFPESIVLTAEEPGDSRVKDTYMICKLCKATLHHEDKPDFLALGEWVPAKTDADKDKRGFKINQLYSSTMRPWELADLYLTSLIDPAAEQEFFNSKLGEAHIVEGAKIDDEDIEACVGTHTMQDKMPSGLITMGVDVGRWLHFEIAQWHLPKDCYRDVNMLSKCRVISAGKVVNFDELGKLMRDYQIRFCVIDANPERRKAFEFANCFWGFVRMCFYGRGLTGKNINEDKPEEHRITVDRTAWLDLGLGRFRSKTIVLPRDISNEYKSHMKNVIRVYERDVNGNAVSKYVKAGEDHFAHARAYNEMALPLAVAMAENRSISSIN